MSDYYRHKIYLNLIRVILLEHKPRIPSNQQNLDQKDYEQIGTVIKILPLTGLRGEIAERMVMSVNTSAQYTITLDTDVTEVQKARRHLSRDIRKLHGVGIRFVDVIALAVSNVLKIHPNLNSIVVGEEARQIKEVHLGMAVALDDGVLVPVIRNADLLNTSEMAQATNYLQKKAKSHKLLTEETEGNTFAISLLGTVDVFTPIINPPAVAVLGIGRVHDKAVVVGGNVVPRTMTTLSLTLDHRVIDGGPGANFLQSIKRLLENPKKLFNVKKLD